MHKNKTGRIRARVTERIEQRVVATATHAVKYVHAVPPEEATGLVAEVYQQLAEDFQITSPLVLHSPAPRLLAAVWCALRETLIAGRIPRAHKEAIAIGVSHANACPYCVSVHAMMLHGTGETAVAETLLAGDTDDIAEPQLRNLARWASRTLAAEDPLLREPPFSASDEAEIIGTAVAFHYINRMVNVFLGESPVPGRRWWLGRLTRRVLGATFGRRMVMHAPPPGASLSLLPESPLPPDLGWATSNSFVAGALARAVVVADEAGRAVLPDNVRELVSNRIAAWRGEVPGISRAWAMHDIESLDEADNPLAAFALLSALAPYQVDPSIIEAFRARRPTDQDLIGAAGWAAFTAARRVGGWLASARVTA
jgi:AhpD family alkylhydroperoxidase